MFQSNITIITGGGDSTFKVWQDFTIEQELLDKQANLERIQEEQKLSSLIREQDFLEAAVLAFKMNKIRDFYHILLKLMTKQDEPLDQVDSAVADIHKFERLAAQNFTRSQSKPEENEVILSKILTKLKGINNAKLIDVVRKLNCKYEYAPLAQTLMNKILPTVEVDELLKSCNKDKQNPIDAMNVFETINLYNQKHYTRMDKHLQNSYFVDYVVSLMTLQGEESDSKIVKIDTD